MDVELYSFLMLGLMMLLGALMSTDDLGRLSFDVYLVPDSFRADFAVSGGLIAAWSLKLDFLRLILNGKVVNFTLEHRLAFYSEALWTCF